MQESRGGRKMRKTEGVALIIVLLSIGTVLHLNIGYVQGGPTTIKDPITKDTTWNFTGSPYILIQDIAVYPAAVLTIEPGVVVRFADGVKLSIFGGLKAQGNALLPITFTSNSTTPARGIWDRVIFAGVKGFSMDYALVEYATTGLKLDSEADISDCVISNCNVGVEGSLVNANRISVTDNAGDGLSLTGSHGISIRNSNISNNGGYGIFVAGSPTLDLNNCRVLDNARDGAVLSNGGTIENSLISDNTGNGTCILGNTTNTTIRDTQISDNGGDGIWAESGTSITNCNITGNAKNGISCDHIGESTIFQNCHLRNNGGDGIWTNSSVEINGTDIIFNGGNGVTAVDDGNMTVSWSSILNNTLNGLAGRGSVSLSNVTGNKLCGIVGNFTVQSNSNVTWNTGGGFNGTGSIFRCSIFSNTPYDAVSDIWPNNVTAKSNWWGTNESQTIQEHIYDHNDDEGLGYVSYDPWLDGPPQYNDTIAPELTNVTHQRTSPEPYVSDPKFPAHETGTEPVIRMNEPVIVSANVTDDHSPTPSGVDKVFLSYRVNGSEWWRTTMTYNETSGYWVVIVPGQRGNSTVEFFIDAYDKNGNHAMSPTYSYVVKNLPIGDINGDDSVDMADISLAIDHFMEAGP
jgi:hypothetical protein